MVGVLHLSGVLQCFILVEGQKQMTEI